MYSDSIMRPSIAPRYLSCNSVTLVAESSVLLSNISMKTIEEIRRQNLLALAAQLGSQVAIAEATGLSTAQINQWAVAAKTSKTGRPRAISSDSARHIEAKLGLEHAWMDNDHSAQAGGLTFEERALLAQWKMLSVAERKVFSTTFASLHQSHGRKKSA